MHETTCHPLSLSLISYNTYSMNSTSLQLCSFIFSTLSLALAIMHLACTEYLKRKSSSTRSIFEWLPPQRFYSNKLATFIFLEISLILHAVIIVLALIWRSQQAEMNLINFDLVFPGMVMAATVLDCFFILLLLGYFSRLNARFQTLTSTFNVVVSWVVYIIVSLIVLACISCIILCMVKLDGATSGFPIALPYILSLVMAITQLMLTIHVIFIEIFQNIKLMISSANDCDTIVAWSRTSINTKISVPSTVFHSRYSAFKRRVVAIYSILSLLNTAALIVLICGVMGVFVVVPSETLILIFSSVISSLHVAAFFALLQIAAMELKRNRKEIRPLQDVFNDSTETLNV